MKARKYHSLLENALQRQLNLQEMDELQELFAADPAARAEWEEEIALDQALRELPMIPVSSNFTARVLQAARREMAKPAPQLITSWPSLVWRQWLPRGFAALALFLSFFFGYEQFRAYDRTRMVESVTILTRAGDLPAVQDLKDFEIIEKLPPRAASDAELLAALQP